MSRVCVGLLPFIAQHLSHAIINSVFPVSPGEICLAGTREFFSRTVLFLCLYPKVEQLIRLPPAYDYEPLFTYCALSTAYVSSLFYYPRAIRG
jgi:hypothetical protein